MGPAHLRGARKTARHVCEVPTIIERRLFTLGRAIAQATEWRQARGGATRLFVLRPIAFSWPVGARGWRRR
jgi:hypothetical protein